MEKYTKEVLLKNIGYILDTIEFKAFGIDRDVKVVFNIPLGELRESLIKETSSIFIKNAFELPGFKQEFMGFKTDEGEEEMLIILWKKYKEQLLEECKGFL